MSCLDKTENKAADSPSLVLTVLALFYGISINVCRASDFQLILLHTNDVHARVEQTSRDSGKCTNVNDCFAGVARRYTKIREIRSNEQNVLLLDAGDQYQGTMWFNVYKGKEAAHFMKMLGYQAMALGNHEFDNGVDGLINPFFIDVNFSFPILSANIKADAQLAPSISGYYVPFKILNVGMEKIGVVGYTSRETPVLSNSGPHLIFEDEVTALQQQVDKLKTLGVKKIIALGHSGFETDKLIAKNVKDVDVVIGGHTNTFLYTGTPPSTEFPAGPYPYMVDSIHGYKVPVVQAYAFGKYLGYLKVIFDEEGNVKTATGNPILLDRSIPEDPAVLADVNKWKEGLKNFSAMEIGRTLVYLNGSHLECRFRECNMGNLICDAAVHHNIRYPDEKRWNHVSVCIINGGGVRAPIDERNSNGSITMEDLISVLPFGSTFDLVEVKGSTLKKAFEHSVQRHGQGTGEFLQVSGVHVVYDVKKEPGKRVVNLEILCNECRVPTYMPVEEEKVYKVILSSYIAQGGDGFIMLRDEKLKHDSGDTDLSVVSEYIKVMKRVYPPVEGRIKFSSASILIGSVFHTQLKIVFSLLFTRVFIFS
ncbi:5'-nucleotidase [Protopterus annectens]|uniref:5'-nucleotidase n=1 Tax=Protopterus annectens TaxID=7888 RepID=UPI001CFC42AF|nr:5'-nucleotidase [Protopterus annectens]